MLDNKSPNPNVVFPISNINSIVYIKNVVKNKNIIAGDFSYFSDDEAPEEFEKHVTHHYDFNGDKLIIGKFCAIAKGVEFIMNGANHQMNSLSTYPFYIFKEWDQQAPSLNDMPIKGDTVIDNDVWIGQNVTILPGIHIGSGSIIGANSTVSKDVAPYSIVAGNPARLIRKRFDDELINILLKLKWWDMEIEEIKTLVPTLSNPNPEVMKSKLISYLNRKNQNEIKC